MPPPPPKEIAPGVFMPVLGFGAGGKMAAYGSKEEDTMKQIFEAALDAGFRHLDDAEMYTNEVGVGAATLKWLKKTGNKRSDLFITSKVMSVDTPGTYASCVKSLEQSGLEYFDLYLVHTPFKVSGKPFATSLVDIWKDMEKLVDDGKARAIGVSNFRIEDLETIYPTARIKPCCNQVEAHPYLQQTALKKYCDDHKIVLTSYTPLAPIKVPKLQGGAVGAAIEQIAKAHNKTPGQVLLRWNYQSGRIPLTTTTSATSNRIKESLDVLEFELTPAEVEQISNAGLEKQVRTLFQNTALGPDGPMLSNSKL